MRVLFVTPVAPWPLDTGGRIRTAKLLKVLAPHAEVHLRAVRQPELPSDAPRELARLCASVRLHERAPARALRRWTRSRPERWFHSPSLEAGLARELAEGGWDLVHLDEPSLVRALPARVDVPVCVHHHKLDTLLHARLPAASALRKGLEGVRLARLEAEAARRFRHHVLTSPDDARALGARFPHLQLDVVPSGFDDDYFWPRTGAPGRSADRLLFLGTLDYGPNVDALRWLAGDILPRVRAARSEVVLDVVGRDPGPEIAAIAGAGVRLVGPVRDVRPSLARAACLVAPLRIGGGTRLKLVDALALACPVVATPAAAEGLELESGRHLLLAEDAAQLASAILDLLADPELGRRLGREGRRRVLELYTWDALGQRLLAAWRRTAAGPARARPA